VQLSINRKRVLLTQGSNALLNNEPVVEPIKFLKTSLLKDASGSKLLSLSDNSGVFILELTPPEASSNLKVKGLSNIDTSKEFLKRIGLKLVWLLTPVRCLLRTVEELVLCDSLCVVILSEFMSILRKWRRLRVGKARKDLDSNKLLSSEIAALALEVTYFT
jgi:hypothetical protein